MEKYKVLFYFIILILCLLTLKRYVNTGAYSYQQEESKQPHHHRTAAVDIKPAELSHQISESNSPKASEIPCCSRHDKVKIACITGTVTVLTAALAAGTSLAIHFGNCK